MDRVARRGPLAQAPGALKGDTSGIVNIFVAVEGGTLRRKNKFPKKSHNAEKLKGGTLWGFSTSILPQNIKKLKGGTLWGFSTSILPQNIKKLKGGKFLFSEKISQCRKKL